MLTLQTRQAARVWSDEDQLATPLVLLYIDRFADEAETPGEHIQWDPITIQSLLETTYHVEPPQIVLDRLLAGLHILGTNTYATYPHDFIVTVNVLDGITSVQQEQHVIPADTEAIAWGVTEMTLLLHEIPELSPEVVGYIRSVLLADGLMSPPKVLKGLTGDDELGISFEEFADDPVMFQAVSGFQQQKAEEVDRFVRERMDLLAQQLEALPLQHGSTDKIVEALQAARASF